MIESTSATLVRLVSSLVYGGAITKPSLTLAQCIQQHVGRTNINLTTLGLAVKLHNKHVSSELVKTLNEHGITSSYDEVLRFRKSVAKFVTDNQLDSHKKLGLNMKIGPIFSWADNYDLYIATCPPRHRYDNACVPPKDSECLWNAVQPRLSRPPIVSDCMNEPQRWSGLILHPGMMHTLTNGQEEE